MNPHVFRCCCEEAPIVFVRLEQDDVELGQKVESQGDVGGERETDAGGDHLREENIEEKNAAKITHTLMSDPNQMGR